MPDDVKPKKAGAVKPPKAATAKPSPQRPTASDKAAPKTGGKSTKKPPGRPRQLKTRIEDFFVGISLAVTFTGDVYSAEVIRQGAGPMAEAWDKLANEDVRVKAMIERLLAGSAYTGVATSTLAVVFPILIHKGILPASFPNPFGMIDTEAAAELENQMKDIKNRRRAE